MSTILGALFGSRRKVKQERQVIYVVQRSPTLEERLEEFFEHGILAVALWVMGNMIAEEMYKQIVEQYKKELQTVSS